MQVNTSIWGDSSTWKKDTFFWSTSSTFTDNNLAWFNAANRTILDNGFALNQSIDYSICYAAHAAAEKMPLADIAVYDYQANIVLEQTETAGFFFCDYPNTSAAYNEIWAWTAIKDNITADLPISGIYRWLPDAYTSYNSILNCCGQTRPVVQFGIKSVFFDVLVVIVKNDYTVKHLQWLSELETNIDTYKNDYHIEECFGRLWTYNGRNAGNFNPFTQNTRNKFSNIGEGGIAIDKNLKIIGSSKEFNNYDMYLFNGYLPIFGSGQNNVDNYRNQGHYGIRIYKRYHSYYDRYDRSYPIAMASAADLGVSVYPTTDEYGYPIYLLNPKMSITANNLEKLRQGAAAYGLFFTDSDPTPLLTDTTNEQRWTLNTMYCGVLDENGVGHGEYTKGTDNLTNPIFSRDTSQDSPYNPAHIDPNTYSNTTGFNSISGGASMTKRYVLDKTNVDKLADDLWTISSELAQVQGNLDYDHFEAKVIDNFLVTSPIDAIVSLKRYPFEVPHTFSNTKELVKLGKNTATAQGYASYNVFNTVQFAGVDINKRFGGSFLDYEPYTCYELYVPFCGTARLQASDIIGHTLNVRLQIDLLTGTCTAYIMADSLVIETLTGSCGCDLQVTGTDTTYMNSAIVNAITNAQSAKANKVVADTSTMTPAGLVSAFINPWKTAANRDIANANMYKADYELQHIQTPLHSMGTASALTGWYQEFDARIIIYYPEGDVIQSSIPPSFNKAALQAFGHTKGFGTVSPGTVSSFHGYTQGTIIADNIPCTESERNRIKEAFASGVFLP